MSLLSNGQNYIYKSKKHYFNSDYDVWLKFIILKAISYNIMKYFYECMLKIKLWKASKSK